jgi:hypothetical protein
MDTAHAPGAGGLPDRTSLLDGRPSRRTRTPALRPWPASIHVTSQSLPIDHPFDYWRVVPDNLCIRWIDEEITGRLEGS